MTWGKVVQGGTAGEYMDSSGLVAPYGEYNLCL